MVNDFLINLLDYVQYILILPFVIGLLHFAFIKKEIKIVFYYVLLAITSEIISRTLVYFFKFSNILPLLHIYTVFEFFIIWLFFFKYFNNFYSKKRMKILLIVFIFFAIFNSIFIQKIYTFNTYVRSLESLIIVALTLLTFNKIINELDTRYPTQQPVFWINSGFLFYFSGNLVVFTLSNYFSKDNHLLSVSWGIHAILMVILNCFIAIGLWRTKPQ
ncbi:hypothetical protein EGI22_10495 [Lacihabitans sp. LS3-19]|nr:hypothetical protein [Lacihabitans sp. LS3-19]